MFGASPVALGWLLGMTMAERTIVGDRASPGRKNSLSKDRSAAISSYKCVACGVLTSVHTYSRPLICTRLSDAEFLLEILAVDVWNKKTKGTSLAICVPSTVSGVQHSDILFLRLLQISNPLI